MADRDDFLILHTPVDRAWADWIVWQLEQAWFTATVRSWDVGLRPLTDLLAWSRDNADRVLVVASESLAGALARDAAAACALEPMLSDRAQAVVARVRANRLAGPAPIDLVGLDEETAREALLAGARQGRPVARAEAGRLDEGIRGSTRHAPYPGGRAPVFRALARRAALFTGRDAELARLDDELARGPVVLAPAHAGSDGWGLTALAREYAYASAARHAVVWWVRAADPLAFEVELAALGHALGLPERAAKLQATVVEAVRRWLAEHDGWLLVIDGAADPALVSPWLPPHAGGRVLITSPHTSWPAPSRSLPVPALSGSACDRFLTHRCAPVDADGAEELAHLLNGHPLALHLAAGACNLLGRPPSALLPELAALIDRALPGGRFLAPLQASTALALDALRERRPAAAELVRVAAWLAPDEIPLKLFETSVSYLAPDLAGSLGDHDDLHDIVHLGERSGLIDEAAEDHISLHPAVSRAIRATLTPEARVATSRAASALVCYGGSFFFHDGITWAATARWLPHAHAVIRHVAAEGTVTRQTLELARHLADTRATAGRLDDAVAVADRALSIAERLEGATSREASRCVSELAWLHGRRGDRASRRNLLAKALEIAEAAGAEPREVGDRLIELAAEQEAAGETAEACALYERAAAILDGQPDAAVVHRRLADLYLKQGNADASARASSEASKLEDLFGL